MAPVPGRGRRVGRAGRGLRTDARGPRRLPGADAALISLETQDGPPILGASGLPAESIELPLYVPRGRGGEEHRSIELSFRYADDESRGGAGGSRTTSRGSTAGSECRSRTAPGASASSPSTATSGATASAPISCTARTVAERAAPAIENARRFREARQLADLDALTGMQTAVFPPGARARVPNAPLRPGALPDRDRPGHFKQVNDRVGHPAGRRCPRRCVRAHPGRGAHAWTSPAGIGGDEFAVTRPSSLAAMPICCSRGSGCDRAGAGRPGRAAGVSGGIAELQKNASPTDFFDAADEALYRAKHAGKAQAAASSRTA